LGFRVQGSGFWVQSLGFRILGFRVQGLGFKGWGGNEPADDDARTKKEHPSFLWKISFRLTVKGLGYKV
jgi:hypothetical protein